MEPGIYNLSSYRHRSCWGGCFLFLILMVSISSSSLRADDFQPHPTSTTKPDHRNEKIIRQFLRELSDDNSSVRAAAAVNLMGMDRDDLAVLCSILKTTPVDAQQRATIPMIVKQVYMATEPYQQVAQGFLGLRFDIDQQVIDPDHIGVEVRHRLPGFCAYRYFEDGDVILRMAPAGIDFLFQDGTGGMSQKKLQDARVELHSIEELQNLVKSYAPGHRLEVEILRRGRVRELSVPVDARPVLPANEGLTIDNFVAEREQRADEYWSQTFESVLDHGATKTEAAGERVAGEPIVGR